MTDMKLKDAFKLDTVELDKSEPYPEENVPPKMVYTDIFISPVSKMEIKKTSY